MNDFTSLDVIWDVFYLDDHSSNLEARKAQNNSYSFRSTHDIFEGLDEDFGLLAEDAKKNLAAQKKTLKSQKKHQNTFPNKEPYKQNEEDKEEGELEVDDVFVGRGKTTKIYSEEFLEKYLLDIISNENIIVRELAAGKGIGAYHVRKILEKLVRMGAVVKLTTKGVHRDEVIYGTVENIKATLHLTKTCATCVSYDHKTRQCKTNRILFEKAYSSLTLEQLKRATNPLAKTTRACGGYQEATESKDFTLDYSDFGSFTRESIKVLSNKQGVIQDEFRHSCLFCSQEIKAFRSSEEPFFPSRKITCNYCNSKYINLPERNKVRCISDNRNITRSIIISELAYEPEILKQKEERIPITVDDDDAISLKIIHVEDNRNNLEL